MIVYIRGEPHSWWIRPRVNIVFWLYVVCTVLSIKLQGEHPVGESSLELNVLSWLHSGSNYTSIKMTLFWLSLVTMPPFLTTLLATYTHHVICFNRYAALSL